MWLNPIIDRTQYDVEYADMNRGDPNPLKGMRNASDLNRIGGNLRYARRLLRDVGYHIPEILCRDDWGISDIPRESDIMKIRADVTALRAVPLFTPNTPDVPTLPYLHYEKLNDIERILFDVYTIIQKVHKSYIGTNEIGCGEL